MRPELPDPQQDRHVAFPELGPTPDPDPPRTEPAAPAAPAEPAPAARRRRPAWLRYAAVIGILIVMGQANGGGVDVTVDAGNGYAEQQWGVGRADPWADDAPDPATAGWTSTVQDPSIATEPIPQDSPVSPVPLDPTVLRVEVVSATAQPVSLTISTSSGLHEESPEMTPLVKEVHLGSGTRSVDVAVSRTSGTSDLLQCRVYAGAALVAIHTLDTGAVTCNLTW